jgi:hypothetical protein
VAIADQGRLLAGKAALDGPSQLLPMVYGLPAPDFHDVTAGTSFGQPHFLAGPGYDLVTGRGTPVANLVVADLVGTSAAAGVLQNAGFESPAVGAGAFGAFQYDPAGTPWTFAGNAGVSGNGSGFTAGNPNAPEGAQVAFLQTTGSFSQALNLAAGTYRVGFTAAQRGNGGGREDFRVTVDGNSVGTFTPATTSYATLTTAVFTVTAGSHTIAFQGLDTAGGDNTAFIDAIQVPAVSAALPSVPDGGFEAPAQAAGSFQYDPAGTPWAYSGDAGVAANGSGFTAGNPDAPEGAQVAFLQTTGSFTQAVTLAAGSYQLTFLAARRGNGGGHEDFRVTVDGNSVGTFTPASTSYAALTTSSFTVAAGMHTITFLGLDSAGGDNTAFIDNIQLTQ